MWTRDDCYEPIVHEAVCPNCGQPTVRKWTTRVAVHGDDPYIGGKTFENMGHEPVTVYSRDEYKRALIANNVREYVRHSPTAESGGDKSKHTSRWV